MGLVFVTGGSRGLGREVARNLREQGNDIVLISRDPQRLATTAVELDVRHIAIDLNDVSTARAGAEQALNDFGIPDAVVLAHGVMSDRTAKTLRTNDAEWMRVMNVNLNSVFTLVNAWGAPMAERRSGRIIVFSACLGRMSGPGTSGGLAPYRISKAGVNAVVKNLAHETGHGSRGFLIDAVCPNHTRTDMGGPDAPRSVEEGAETAIWLATRSFAQGDTTGVLWEDRQIVPW